MKVVRTFLVVCAVAMLLATVVQAQDRPDRERPRRPEAREGRERPEGSGDRDTRRPTRRPTGFGMRGYTLTEALAELELTQAQKAEIDKILQVARQGGGDRSELGKIYAAMRKAQQAGDKEAYEAARKKAMAIRSSGRDQQNAVIRQLAGPLTDRQMMKLRELMGPSGGFQKLVASLDKIELTPEQDRKLGQTIRKVEAKAGIARTNEEKVKLYTAAGQTVMEMLTDEQKSALRRSAMQQRVGAMFKTLGVTDDQQTTIDAIRAEARKKAEGASGEERGTIYREAYKKIFSEVFTEEQQAKFRKMREQRGGRGPGRGRGRGRGEGGGEGRGEGGGEGRGDRPERDGQGRD